MYLFVVLKAGHGGISYALPVEEDIKEDRIMELADLKTYLPDYLSERGIPTKKGELFKCLDPNHPDNNPSMGYYQKGQIVHCFACGASYDIFDLVMMERGCSFSEAKEWIAEHYAGIEPRKDEPGRSKARPGIEAEIRALGADTAIGYLTESRGFKNAAAVSKFACVKGDAERIYFPHFGITERGREITDYQARVFSGANKGRYRRRGETTLYNPSCLFQWDIAEDIVVVVTEGEIDCLSIYDLKADPAGEGGLESYHAIALSGVSNVGQLLARAGEYGENSRGHVHFMLALDNDNAGRDATAKLAKGLEGLGYKWSRVNLSGEYHDINECLQKDRGALRGRLRGYLNDRAELERESADDVKRERYIGAHSSRNALNAVFSDFDNKDGNSFIEVGFPGLNGLFSALRAGTIVLGALSSAGKTTLFLQLADQIAGYNKRDVLYFSLEQSAKELVTKSLSRITFLDEYINGGNAVKADLSKGIPAGGVLRGSEITKARRSEDGKSLSGLNNKANILLQEAYFRYDGLSERLYIIDPTGIGGMTLKDIESAVREHIEATGNVPIVFIDYLQIIKPQSDHASDKQAMDSNVTGIRRLCSQYQTIVFAVSSISRTNYYTPVSMESFKESGAIEYGSDILLGMNFSALHDPETKKTLDRLADNAKDGRAKSAVKDTLKAEQSKPVRKVTIEVLKNRNGETGGEFDFNYYAPWNTFVEIENGVEAIGYQNDFIRGCEDMGKARISQTLNDDELPF